MAMHVILFLICVTSINSLPCKKRITDELESARRNDGFRYYFHTTTTTTPRPTRSPFTFKTITPRGKICAPYEFNETICEYVGDRELCGYNKNPEVVQSKSNAKVKFLSNGCWLRKGRVECGYHEPFDTIRRPPIVYPNFFRKENDQNTVHYLLNGRNKLVTVTTTTSTTTTTVAPTTVFKECVEIHSRIVCRTTHERVVG